MVISDSPSSITKPWPVSLETQHIPRGIPIKPTFLMTRPLFSSNEMNLQNRYPQCAWSGGLLAAAAPAALQALVLSILALFFGGVSSRDVLVKNDKHLLAAFTFK